MSHILLNPIQILVKSQIEDMTRKTKITQHKLSPLCNNKNHIFCCFFFVVVDICKLVIVLVINLQNNKILFHVTVDSLQISNTQYRNMVNECHTHKAWTT